MLRPAAVTVLLLGLFGSALVAPPTQAAALPGDVVVLVEALEPRAVRPGSDVRVSGTVLSRAETELSAVRVQLRVRATPVGSRSELAAEAVRAEPTGTALPATLTAVTDRLTPGASSPFDVTVPADDLGLAGFGVYPFGIEVLADDGAAPSSVVGYTPTLLPWVPEGASFEPTRLAWVLPLTAPPARDADAAYPDDHLAASLDTGGRLRSLVSAVTTVEPAPPPDPPRNRDRRNRPRDREPVDPDAQRAVPVTWAVDAALLQTVADMADGYAVEDDDDSAAGGGRDVAADWLAQLRQRVPTDAVLALPYADADVSALTRAGLDDAVVRTVEEGRSVTASVLGVEPDASLAWPAGGFVTSRALARLHTLGTQRVVLSAAAAPLPAPLSYTPTAGTRLPVAGGRTMGAVVADDVLGAILAAGERGALSGGTGAGASPSPAAEPAPTTTPLGNTVGPTPAPAPPVLVPTPSSPRLVEQRFLAETALVTAERPSDTQELVATPPRAWDPDPRLVADLVADTGRVPWLQPATVPQLALDGVDPRPALEYPPSAQDSELPSSYLRGGPTAVASLRSELGVFRSILQPPAGPRAVALEYATLRTMSVAWREDLAAGGDLRTRVAADLTASRNAVSITSRRLITLASREGTIPITISNELDQPVTVRLRLSASSSARLDAEDSEAVTIAAGHKVTSEVEAVVNQAGLFPVTAQLLTPDDRPFGQPVTLRLRSTAYGQLAVGITAGALAVLLLAVVVRLIRRGLRSRRAPAVAEQR